MLNVYTSARAPSFLLKKKLDKKHKKKTKKSRGQENRSFSAANIKNRDGSSVFFQKGVTWA
jgi:hypothetical protein